jgi:hypothetical protein
MPEVCTTNQATEVPGGPTGTGNAAELTVQGFKTLIFSIKPGLSATSAGFMGQFKMLCLETGQLYCYRVHLSARRYGPRPDTERSRQGDLHCQQRMFAGLAAFVTEYHKEYGSLPSDLNIYHDGRSYTDSGNFFGKKICLKITENDIRPLTDTQLVLD